MTNQMQPVQSGYAPVNGLKMYYEIYGQGEPLVVLHGAYMTIHTMGEIVPRLAKTRQVIAVECQGHGHTTDIDRPLTYEQMADDVAALLSYLNIAKTDVFGYSMGGGVALQIAIRHPELVRKLVSASATYKTQGMYPEILASIEQTTPAAFDGTPWRQAYDQVAPHPEDFPKLVAKLKKLDVTIQDWPATDMQAIQAPTLFIIADSDVVRPEHAVEIFRLLGGGVPGDLSGLPNAQLAVLPGTTHVTLVDRVEWLHSMITEFLDAPLPKAL